MGIKCSLLGHDFSGSKVEEEREEQGSEVLITIKEVETCDRCGKQRVVSENKEVTSLEAANEDADEGDPAEETADEESEESPVTGSSTGVSPTPDIDAAEDDAELIGEAENDEPASDDGVESDPDQQPDPVTPTAEDTDGSVTAADDDAVILDDDDDDEPEREPGEWPDDEEPDLMAAQDDEPEPTVQEDEQAEAATEEWPDEFGYDDETKTAPEVEWPEEDEPTKSDWEPSESLTKQIDGADVEPTGSAAITVPEGEFECPECGFRTSVEESSLRAGDFCPDCHRGSLEHRAEDQTRKE